MAILIFIYYLRRFLKRSPKFIQIVSDRLIVVSRNNEETIVCWKDVHKATFADTFNGNWEFDLGDDVSVVVYEDGIVARDWKAFGAAVRDKVEDIDP